MLSLMKLTGRVLSFYLTLKLCISSNLLQLVLIIIARCIFRANTLFILPLFYCNIYGFYCDIYGNFILDYLKWVLLSNFMKSSAGYLKQGNRNTCIKQNIFKIMHYLKPFCQHWLYLFKKNYLFRQTLLFSATLPKSLVEFAKAGSMF